MDWNDLRVLVEVARAGSFTAAAVTLGSSKPTVSRRVAELERCAGTRLFRRSPNGAVLTESGEMLLQRALRIETEVLDFERALQVLKRNAAPLVSVRMSEGVAAYLIAPALAGQELGPLGMAAKRLHLALPPMRILQPDNPHRADVSLVWTPKGEIPKAGANDKVRKLTDVSFVPFHSSAYLGRASALESFRDLGKHQLVTMSAYNWFGDDGWAEWHRLLDQSGSVPVTVDWTCSLGHLTLSGAGIGLLPSYTPMYSDGMQRIDIPMPSMVASIWMVHDENAAADRAVRSCIDALAKIFRDADWMHCT